LDSSIKYRSAAVLLLIFPKNGKIFFPLIRRSEHLRNHQGQIALPGGAVEEGEDPVSAALRESEEELGIDGKSVQVLGPLTPFAVDVSRFLVYPIVGALSRVPQFKPSPDEVADYFTVSLSDLLDPRLKTTMELTRDGQIYRVPCFSFSGTMVWGATAMALAEFRALCDLANRQ
jgi:8-oxo-dGTP pyrophosphatase MutT (NUDIX family)